MGIAFINKAKNTFQKSWSKGAERLKEPDLNTARPEDIPTILVRPIQGFTPSVNDQYELQLNGQLVEIYLNRARIGESLGAAASIISYIKERGGKGIGSFWRSRAGSKLIDIAVWI